MESRESGLVSRVRSETARETLTMRTAEPTDPAELTGRSNEELIRFALAGGAQGQRAWALLVRQNSNAVWHAVWKVDVTRTQREDLFQSTWLRALENLQQLREPDKFHIWVMAIARNEANALFRRKVHEVGIDDLREVAGTDGAFEEIEREERRQLFARALARLSPEQQELMRLLSTDPPTKYADIERLMGWAPGGVAIRRSRCLAKLLETPEIKNYLASLDDETHEEEAS